MYFEVAQNNRRIHVYFIPSLLLSRPRTVWFLWLMLSPSARGDISGYSVYLVALPGGEGDDDQDDLRLKVYQLPMNGISEGCGMPSRTMCGLDAIQAHVGRLGKLAAPPVTMRPVAVSS